MAKKVKIGNVPNLRFEEFGGEWEIKKMGEAAPLQRGFDLPVDKIQNGEYPVVFSNGILKFHNEFKVKAPGVITGRSGTIGKVTFVEHDYWPHNTSLWVTDFEKNIPKFIFYFYSRYNLERFGTGSGVPTLNRNNVHSQMEYFPSSNEQKKIADFLTLIDKRISTQSKIIEELKLLKTTISKKLFSLNLRFKDGNKNDFSPWEAKTLGEVCEITGGGTPATNKSEYWNGNIQWFTPTEIKASFVSKSERTITELGLKNSSAKILPKGTILLTTRATIGEASIALKECTTNQGFQSLVVKESYNNVFIYNWIKENKYEITKRANGSTFSEISKSEIEKIVILIPALEEQTKIAQFLSFINGKIETERKLLKHLEYQKKYLLSNLFI